MGFSDAMPVHEEEQVVGELAYGEGRLSPGRFAVASGVRGVNAEPFAEGVQLRKEIAAVAAVAVEQYQGRALPFFYVKVLDIHETPAPGRPFPPRGRRSKENDPL